MGCSSSKALTCEEAPVPIWFSRALFDFFALAIELKLIRSNYDFTSMSIEVLEDFRPYISKMTQMIWDEIARSVGDDVYHDRIFQKGPIIYELTDITQKKIKAYEIDRIMAKWLTPAFVSKQIEKLEYTAFFEKSFPDDRDCHMLVYKHMEPAYEDNIYIFHFSESVDKYTFPKCRITPSERGKAGIEYGIVF